MGVMEALTAVLTITLPIIVTVVLSNYQTQRIIQATIETSNRQTRHIIRNSNRQTRQIIETYSRQTQRILRKLERCLVKISRTQEEIKRVQRDTACTLKKIQEVQADTNCLLRKVDLGLRANALMHGWRRADGITPERARRLPEPKVYDPELRVCYYQP